MYNLLIVGTGYVGREIAKYYVAKKQRVFVMTRSAEKARSLEAEGMIPVLADLNKPETLNKIPHAHFVVISVAPDERTEEAYRKVYLEGVSHFLQAIKKNVRPHLIVYLSSTGVWENIQEGWVDELLLPTPVSERGKILLKAEVQVINSGFPATIFRLAGIYGPGRNRIQMVRDQRWPETMEDRYMNLIHRDDVVGAIPYLFKSAEVGATYLGIDHEPVRTSDFYRFLCDRLGVDFPEGKFVVPELSGKQCRSERLKALGFNFKYPTFREGYEEILTHEA